MKVASFGTVGKLGGAKTVGGGPSLGGMGIVKPLLACAVVKGDDIVGNCPKKRGKKEANRKPIGTKVRKTCSTGRS